MEKNKNETAKKYVVLATYLIAVVCLILGLFLPFFGGDSADGMLALQLPDVINRIANKNVTDAGKDFALSYPVNIGSSYELDVMAYAALLYAAVTLFALVALIPVGISTKKGTRTASVFAYIVETAAVILTSVYFIIALEEMGDFSYSMLAALAGTLLALVVLSVMNKKGTGAVKTLLFLLSAVALLALYDFSIIIPELGQIKLAPTLFGEDAGTGIDSLRLLFEGGFGTELEFASEAKDKAVLLLCTIAAILVVINYLIDIIGLATDAKKTGLVFNVARYGLETLAVLCLFITVTICKYAIGIMLIVLPAAVVIQLLISVIRLIMNLKKAKKAGAEDAAPAEEAEQVEHLEPVRAYRQKPVLAEPVVQAETVREEPEPVYMEPAPARQGDKYGFNEPAENEPVQMDIFEAQKPEQKPVPVQPATPVQANTGAAQEPQTHIYTINTIYGGPVDDFMKKLTNDERIEFAMTFIEKSKGNIGNIPDYVIGGNNRLFFSSVFIYLGRIRGLISDGLLNKMYKELNML